MTQKPILACFFQLFGSSFCLLAFGFERASLGFGCGTVELWVHGKDYIYKGKRDLLIDINQ